MLETRRRTHRILPWPGRRLSRTSAHSRGNRGRAVIRFIRRAWLVAFLWIWIGAALGGGGELAYAHTALSGSSPGAGETLETPPERLHLTFSGKLESSASLHSIALTGPDGAAIALEPPTLDSGMKSLETPLPALANGTYDVSYRVVSADGHPIEGAFAFEVAAPEPVPEPEPEPTPEPEPVGGQEPAPETTPDPAPETTPEPASETGADEHAGHHETAEPAPASASGEGAAFAALLYGSRIVYYGSLLPLLGWALWSALRPQAGDRLAYWRRIGLRLQALHLAAFIAHVAVQWAELSSGAAEASFLDTLRETSTGQSWLFTALLSLAGFPLLFRHRAVDAGWAALVIAAKTLRGHASAFEPVALARLTDAVHLGAAAIWIGGLLALALALLLRKFPDGFRAFAPSFSTAALTSYAVLAATGFAAALFYTETLADLPQTTWGRLLIVKTALAVAVLPVAALLRRRLLGPEGRAESFRAWFRADVALLVGIVGVTGVLTHMSPVVQKVPFHWHVMGTTAHLTADIADVREGVNTLSLKIWVPEGEAAPAVTVVAAVPGEPDRTASLRATDVPTEEWESFSGFAKYTFVGEIDIADPATAELRVRIQRSGGGETLEYAQPLAAAGTPQ